MEGYKNNSNTDKIEGKQVTNVSYEKAREILGKNNFIGKEDIQTTFGIELKDIPTINFTEEELVLAKKLNQSLILYIDKDDKGNPLTLERIAEIEKNKSVGSFGRSFLMASQKEWDESPWKLDDPVLAKETPRLDWRLSGNTTINRAKDKKSIYHTNIIGTSDWKRIGAFVEYIKNKVFKEVEMPADINNAISEFENTDYAYAVKDYGIGGDMFKNSKITQLCLERVTEIIYRLMVLKDKGGMPPFNTRNSRKPGAKLVDDGYAVWTSSVDSHGNPLLVGGNNQVRVIDGKWYTRISTDHDATNMIFSRKK